MSLKKITEAAVRVIRDLPVRPTGPTGRYTGVQLQAFFDKAAQNIRDTFNELVSKLESSDGASEIGFSETDTVHGANVQEAIEDVQEQVRSAYSESAIPDGSVTGDKILAGSLLVDVTNAVRLQYLGENYINNNLRFYYAKALGIVFVRGTIENAVVKLQKTTGGYGYLVDNQFAFSWSGYKPSTAKNGLDLNDYPLYASARTHSTDSHHAFLFYGNQGNEIMITVDDERLVKAMLDSDWEQVQVDIKVSGWYFCDGA